MQIVKKLVGPIVLLLLVLVAVELSYRFYVLGPMALNPFKVNSMNTIMRSEYVQLSEYPDIFFELKPSMRGWYKGVEFWTDSNGHADKEYARTKAKGTFRIAVAGSSWEMPSGVPPDRAWHAVLEEKLNLGAGAPAVEIINFGVEMYGLREIVGTVRHRIAEWDPDMIFVGVTTYTTSLVWDPTDKPQALPPRVYPALVPFSWRALKNFLGGNHGIAPVSDRKTLDDAKVPERMAQLYRAFDEFGNFSKQTGVPIVVVFLDFVPFPEQMEAEVGIRARAAGLQVVFANHAFPEDFEQRIRYQISLFDRHPSEAGHSLIADYVARALSNQGLLPPPY